MTDQELLTYAAKAIDLKWLSYHHSKGLCCRDDKFGGLIEYYWNPLENDADAFQLMVKLNFCVTQWTSESGYQPHAMVGYKRKQNNGGNIIEDHKNDAMAATRRAIVMAAAEIGKGM